ncbi:MAG: class I SAM-dependent methyltransferase [Clostridiales bacterium]|nr:class I SAM-dependent methyltransferase [Clostridiales bacterium]
MWTPTKWTDYELLDCGGGERLERWGSYILSRPDPQAIWNKSGHRSWNALSAKYHRSNDGGGSWEIYKLPPQWQIKYEDLVFNVKPMSFKHTGVFPEQAANWEFISRMIRQAQRPINVLNLFAYTGGATLAAASAGASVCHVDAAKGMVQWARENANSSSLDDKPIRWIVDDCRKFLEREIRRGRKYDAIIMDPPSYGRGPTGEVWKIEDDIASFVELCLGALSENPLLVLISSYTAGLSPSVMDYLLSSIIKKQYGGKTDCSELGLTVASTGLALPCGSSARWIF